MAEFSSPFYKIVDDMLVEQPEAKSMKNADHDAVMQELARYVEDKITQDFAFSRVSVPPMADDDERPTTSILVSHEWESKEKLLIISTNASGSYLGIWSRSLCFSEGLSKGTMIPYISKAMKNDYAVIILRPNNNSVLNSDGKKLPIVGSETPEIHALCVWENVITQAQNLKSISFLSYGNGATLCHDLFLKSTLDSRFDIVTAIACIEASAVAEKDDSDDIKQRLMGIGVNFECSKLCPRGSHMQYRDKRLGCSSLSMGLPLGQTEVVNVAVSAYMALDPVFDFLNVAQKNNDGSAVKAFVDKFARKCKVDLEMSVIKKNPNPDDFDDAAEEEAKPPPTTPEKKPGFFASVFGSGGNSMPAKPTDKPRDLTIDDFALLKVVGKGAFGKVLLVKKKQGANAGQIYAMKVLKKSDVIAKSQVEHTNAEQAILREVKHPFIVSLRFSFQSIDKLYLITDYYSGGNLFAHLRSSKRFSEYRAKFYGAELILALQHLHDNDIIYRDLKLENILMDHSGHIVLTDFGLSKPDIDKSGGASTFCGTAEYIAPELLMYKKYGPAVDWWSFGILVYEMMNGKTPFLDSNKKLMYYRITHSRPEYNQKIYSPAAQVCIDGLLTVSEKERLGANGAEEIKKTEFFSEIDFTLLLKKQLRPPFIPEGSDVSTKYVSKTLAAKDPTRDSSVLPGPVPKDPKLKAEMQTAFKGFEYQEDQEKV